MTGRTELTAEMGPVANHLFPGYPKVASEEVDLALGASMGAIRRAKSASLDAVPGIRAAEEKITDILGERARRGALSLGSVGRELLDCVDAEKLIYQIRSNIPQRYFGVGE